MKKNKNFKIFIACDSSNLKYIKKIISKSKTNKLKIIPKFGIQFFYSKNGRSFLEKFKNNFWLDLKIGDVPQTALSAVDSLKDLKRCRYLTVHASGGLEMLKAVKKKAKKVNKNLKILGVTILTSLNNKSLKEIGHTKSVEQLVLKQAKLIRRARLDGIVCSGGLEAKIIKKKYKNLFVVTPGIRFPEDSKDDQKRVVTPRDALILGKADAIVIGRSLVRGKIKNNLKKLIQSLN